MPTPSLPPWTRPLREWQADCAGTYAALDRPDFLAVAPPATGKTTLAAAIAHRLLECGAATRVLVVVPTDHLRTQWAQAAAGMGIQLCPDYGFDRPLDGGYHGIVTTYQAVATSPEIYRALCREPLLVACDEVHHAADESVWGRRLQHAFGPAARRLSLSGTPFRTDGDPIPWVTYAGGRAVADFTYTFDRAVADGAIRVPMFPTLEGRMTWLAGAAVRSASFAEPLPDADASRRLRTALDPGGAWLRAAIGRGHARLEDIRRTIAPHAGMLIVTIDQQHARAVARLVREVTGEEPVLAISDDPQASEKIRRFGEGEGRILVAVRLVAEGVDLPRLYVGLYASNIVTEIYFRQLLGRLLRQEPGIEGQVAALILPNDPRLAAYAARVMEERDQALGVPRDEGDGPGTEGGSAGPRPGSGFVPLLSEATEGGTIHDGRRLSPLILAEAERHCRALGRTAPADVLFAAQLLAQSGTSAEPEPAAAADIPLYALRRALRNRRQVLVQLFGARLQELTGGNESAIYRIVNERVADQIGATVGEATVEQLQAQVALLLSWAQQARRALRQGVGPEWVRLWAGGA